MEENRLIDMELHRLDCVAISLEAKYGIGKLQELAPAELKLKWQAQMQKLQDAILENDSVKVRELVEGSIRGWNVLEQNAVALGCKPIQYDYMEVKLSSGFHLRIARNMYEARTIGVDGVTVWSLEEVARVLEKDYTLVNKVKETFEGAEVKSASSTFDFKKGDDIEF